MTDNQTLQRFMELRAQNKSYAAIERELGVTKKTLIVWGKEHREQIANLAAIENEAMLEKYGLTAPHELSALETPKNVSEDTDRGFHLSLGAK